MQLTDSPACLYFEKKPYQKIMAIIISIYVIFLVLLSFPEYSKSSYKSIILTAFGIIFILEYIIKIAVTLYFKKPLKWTLEFYSIIDLLAIVSFSLSFLIHYNFLFLRVLRVIRIFAAFENNRVSRAINTLTEVIQKKRYDLIASFIVLSVLLLIASCAIYCFENEAQPDKFSSIFHSFWWAIITMTTVGYGDIYPITVGGKVIASVFALIGFGFITLPAAIISTGYLNMRDRYVCEKCGNANESC